MPKITPDTSHCSRRFRLAAVWIFLSVLFATTPVWCVPPSPRLLDSWRRQGRLPEMLHKIRVIPQGAPSCVLRHPSGPQRAPGVPPASGQLRALVLLVDFEDRSAVRTRASIEDMLFSKGTYSTGSLRDYYHEVSYNNLDVIGLASGGGGPTEGWYRVDMPYTYYTGSSFGFGEYPRNAQGLVRDAILKADPYVDFKQYDNDSDGVVDALFVVHAGTGAEVTGNPNDIWSHAWDLPSPVDVDGVLVSAYSMEPEDGTVGVFCHEFGHILGLPDLYDYNYDSEGLGDWSLMASGSWANDGATPVHLDAWCKTRLGWITPAEVKGRIVNAVVPGVEQNPAAYKLPSGGEISEYFLIENRRKTGFDSYLPGEGLLIYHVDENQADNNNQARYLVGLEQADGLHHLERAANRGDDGDPWPGIYGNRNFDDTTNPSSLSYSGVYRAKITNISNPAENMTADLWGYAAAAVPVSTIDPLPAAVTEAAFPVKYRAQCLDGIKSVELYYNTGQGWLFYANDDSAAGAVDYSGSFLFSAPESTHIGFLTIALSSLDVRENPDGKPFNVIDSDNFENGISSWNTQGVAGLTDGTFHSPSHSIELGKSTGEIEPTIECRVARKVSIPQFIAGARLRAWLNQGTLDFLLADWQEVAIYNEEGNRLETLLRTCENKEWGDYSWDLSRYAGQTLEVRFSLKGDGNGLRTWMQVDDYALEVSEYIEKAFTVLDLTPPVMTSITDEGRYTVSTRRLGVSISASDTDSGLQSVRYAVGTLDSPEEVIPWTTVSYNQNLTIDGLSLKNGETYYISAQVQNGVGEWSEILRSDGITVRLLDLSWFFNAGAPVKASASVCEGIAYIGDDNGLLHALRIEDGQEMWSYDCRLAGASMVSSIRSRVVAYTASSGLIRVYAGTHDGYVLCLDTAGNLVWSQHMGSNLVSTPAVSESGLYVSCGRQIYCFNADTGTRIGYSTYFPSAIESSPAVPGLDLVWIGADDGNLYCLNSTLSVIRTTHCMGTAPVKAPPTVDAIPDMRLFIGSSNNNFQCLNAISFESLWGPIAIDGGIEGAAWSDGSSLYIGTTAGKVYSINRETGTVNWIFNASAPVRSALVSVDGWTYFADENGRFYAINNAAPTEFAGYELPGRVTGSPAATIDAGNRSIVIGCTDGNVYAFRLK